ncbi:ImmA/IrrE family metallo-endopeptidase [Arthrobacter pityocampae]|uniref:ImmA/IrrE family metallo-endopeptidase n=1 Tax=Arthrobacter pityocampae TaxID=547334 RepID=UPI003735F5FA
MVSHPWRELRQYPHISITFVDDLPFGIHAQTNGVNHIWMRSTLLQVERRCAITHELTHILYGHRGHQPPAVELSVRVITARELIAFPDLLDARRWSGDCREMADYLNVTPRVLQDRVQYLKGEERDAFHNLE